MRTIAGLVATLFLLASCRNKEGDTNTTNWVSLRADSINVVKITDTLVVYESICRGCAYEGAVQFGISDSLEVVKLLEVITNDNNSAEVEGGSISKDILIKPIRTGITTIRLFKILAPNTAKEDSARFRTYSIHVTN